MKSGMLAAEALHRELKAVAPYSEVEAEKEKETPVTPVEVRDVEDSILPYAYYHVKTAVMTAGSKVTFRCESDPTVLLRPDTALPVSSLRSRHMRLL